MAKYPVSKGWESADWQEWFASLCGEAEERLHDLLRGKGDPAEHVHEIRKMLKRLRAGMRLLRNVVDRRAGRAVQRSCRDAGRLLSGSRDQTVRLQTFESVVGKAGKGEAKSVASARRQLEREAERAQEVAGDKARAARRLLRHAGLPRSRWAKAGRADIRKALRRLLKRARTEYLDIRDGYSEAFHELRKRVKDLYYNLGALPSDAADETGPAIDKLKKLSDILGEENDVAVLMEWFEKEGYGRDAHPDLWKPFLKRERSLRRHAIDEGHLLEGLSKLEIFGG